MAKSKSDISNSAIRIFLQEVGAFYDAYRGLQAFTGKIGQKRELLTYFDHSCCYCGVDLNEKSVSLDHLVPMNKKQLGLHAWGNIVPCCSVCNNKKQSRLWNDFMKSVCAPEHLNSRIKKIKLFIKEKKYEPSLDLHEIADNLYQDIGEVAMTLIKLRYKQAEKKIELLLKKIK